MGLKTEKMVLGKPLRYYDFRFFFFRNSVKNNIIIWEKQRKRVTQILSCDYIKSEVMVIKGRNLGSKT